MRARALAWAGKEFPLSALDGLLEVAYGPPSKRGRCASRWGVRADSWEARRSSLEHNRPAPLEAIRCSCEGGRPSPRLHGLQLQDGMPRQPWSLVRREGTSDGDGVAHGARAGAKPRRASSSNSLQANLLMAV